MRWQNFEKFLQTKRTVFILPFLSEAHGEGKFVETAELKPWAKLLEMTAGLSFLLSGYHELDQDSKENYIFQLQKQWPKSRKRTTQTYKLCKAWRDFVIGTISKKRLSKIEKRTITLNFFSACMDIIAGSRYVKYEELRESSKKILPCKFYKNFDNYLANSYLPLMMIQVAHYSEYVSNRELLLIEKILDNYRSLNWQCPSLYLDFQTHELLYISDYHGESCGVLLPELWESPHLQKILAEENRYGKNIWRYIMRNLYINNAGDEFMAMFDKMPDAHRYTDICRLYRLYAIANADWARCTECFAKLFADNLIDNRVYYDANYFLFAAHKFSASLNIAIQAINSIGFTILNVIGATYAAISSGRPYLALLMLKTAEQMFYPLRHHRYEFYLTKARVKNVINEEWDAIKIYYKLIKDNPEEITLYLEMAKIYAYLGYQYESLRIIQDALKIEPESRELAFEQLNLCNNIENINPEKARSAILSAVKNSHRDAMDFARIAGLALQLQIYGAARELLIVALKLDDKNEEVLYTTALYYYALNWMEQALDLARYGSINAVDPYEFDMLQGNIYMEKGDFANALLCFDKCQKQVGINLEIAAVKRELFKMMGLENEYKVWQIIFSGLEETG